MAEDDTSAHRNGAEPTNPLDEFCEKLSYRMHLTRGARFNAARRHKSRSMASTWAVTALSMYVFTASAYMAIYDLSEKPQIEKPLILMTIVMSAFIIAFSILEQGKKHDLKAELFLRCAQGIQELRDAFEFELRTGKPTLESAKQFSERYNKLIHDFSENHSEVDYRVFRINIGKHKGEHFYSWFHRLNYWMDCWSIMLLAIFVPPFAFAFIVLKSILTP